MKKMTIMEVYSYALENGRTWRKYAENHRDKKEYQEADEANACSDAYYDMAAKLELTEKVNPTK